MPLPLRVAAAAATIAATVEELVVELLLLVVAVVASSMEPTLFEVAAADDDDADRFFIVFVDNSVPDVADGTGSGVGIKQKFGLLLLVSAEDDEIIFRRLLL